MLNKVNENKLISSWCSKKPENYSSNVVRQSFENVLKKTMTTVKKSFIKY